MVYDWVIVGGGVAGISLAEVLTRRGCKILLIEKNSLLAGETTKEFHEWMHTGALYTLLPDGNQTMKYLIGAIDDMFLYYSQFNNMNLIPTNKGLGFEKNINSWFKDDYISFRYRLRKYNPLWSLISSRSIMNIEKIKNHDWLHRQGGNVFSSHSNYLSLAGSYHKYLTAKSDFFEYESSDFVINSRVMLADLLNAALTRGAEVVTNEEVISISKESGNNVVFTKNEKYLAKKVVFCNSAGISKFSDVKVKKSYAPMAVVSGDFSKTSNFVNLDYYVKKSINLIKKTDEIALIGGITLSKKSSCDDYIKYVINEHKKLNSSVSLIKKYVGIKNEFKFKGSNRNYLYNISQISDSVWSLIPGKYSLLFSFAPEFYKQVYKKNPPISNDLPKSTTLNQSLISPTTWQEAKL